ncbi:hypothetical protein [Algihabitans albus]|uniref:hypothetical protein n=1 Tax=Algihabitans albus TaxID=2164067 RepID=UPI000E5CC57A|nr:hypothetical protein [Algihabitans albus]
MTRKPKMPGGCTEDSTVYRVQQMIEDVHHVPGLKERMAQDLEAVFSDYGLSEEQKAALREGAPPSMLALGVHPILCMQWSLVVNEQVRNHVTVDQLYLREMEAF